MRTKITLLILAIALLAPGANTQIVKGYGLTFGTSLASQDWVWSRPSVYMNDKARWGVDVGAFAELLSGDVFSVLVEVHYVQKGYRDYTVFRSDREGTTTGTPRVDYLSVPFLAKARVDIGTVSPFLLVGPRLDIMLGVPPAYDEEVFAHLKSNDFGVTIGGGVEYLIVPSIRIGVEGRYSPGFHDVYRDRYLTISNRSFETLLRLSIL